MDTQLKGRTAIVTGASSGIGRATAKSLALEGVRVAIVARREELLVKLADEIVAAGGPRPEVIAMDVMQPDAPKRIAKDAESRLGSVDILVNCAGGSRFLPID